MGKGIKPVKEWIDKNDPGALMIPYSAIFEQSIFHMSPEEKENHLKGLKTASMLEKIVVNGFSALGLQVFFTAGKDEVKAWTIKKGMTAPKAAGRIHTDFEKGFIMADGKYRQQGKTYIVKDGDIIFFKFNTPSAPKKKKNTLLGYLLFCCTKLFLKFY